MGREATNRGCWLCASVCPSLSTFSPTCSWPHLVYTLCTLYCRAKKAEKTHLSLVSQMGLCRERRRRVPAGGRGRAGPRHIRVVFTRYLAHVRFRLCKQPVAIRPCPGLGQDASHLSLTSLWPVTSRPEDGKLKTNVPCGDLSSLYCSSEMTGPLSSIDFISSSAATHPKPDIMPNGPHWRLKSLDAAYCRVKLPTTERLHLSSFATSRPAQKQRQFLSL